MEDGHKKITDLHCHLLPGIDDGAFDRAEALKLLKAEYNSGVRQIALTSHFNCEDQNLTEFLYARNKAKKALDEGIAANYVKWPDLALKLGAEVFFSPNICRIDAAKLCLEGTPFLLMELPVNRIPAYFEETIYHLQACGIILVIAHVERYQYVTDNPTILCEWIDKGLLIQVNAGPVLEKGKRAKRNFNYLKWNLAHIMASDAHSMQKRPPNLREGLDAVSRVVGIETAKRINDNADLIFRGIQPEINEIHCPIKRLGRWW